MRRVTLAALGLLTIVAVLSLWVAAIFVGRDAWGQTANDSDLWWVPSENGWGVGIHRQNDVIFATLFVYNERGEPTWYVAPDLRSATGEIFSGRLYTTRGTEPRQSWNPGALVATEVGSTTITLQGDRGSLSYSLGGSRIEKAIVRQTFRTLDPTGTYDATAREVRSCSASSTPSAAVDSVRVVLSAPPAENMFALDVFYQDGRNCRYSGTSSQAGRRIQAHGNQYCVFPDGRSTVGGPFTTDISMDGETASLSLSSRETDSGCTQVSGIAGVKRR